ncbi:MAG: DNA repair protein RecN [Clostridiales bacterium]|nr:DNA repair protein RecN [Clostridiales bacterium]
MLQRITIHNLALIRDLEIEFTNELNVFSGETGAGKSIIVDSLMLLVGGRYDKSMLKFGEDSGFVEGVFDYQNDEPLKAVGVDTDDGIFIVTRKFYRDGKNEIRLNGKQITTSMLRELMQNYVDIYGQNEYQSLLKITEQRKILDFFVFKKDDGLLTKERELYDAHKKVVAEMNGLGDETERARRIDLLKYQLDEIAAANVKKGEEDELIERRHILMASERIKNALMECAERLDGEDGATADVADGERELKNIAAFGETYDGLFERLKSVAIELDDIVESVKDELEKMDGSENELDEVNTRLDKLRALKAKYGNYDAMKKFEATASGELERLSNGEELYAELCDKEKKLRKELYTNTVALSDKRHEGAEILQKRILAELADLGMANSQFEVKFSAYPTEDEFIKKVTANGYDECEFYLSPNVGQPMLPLAKIISGGEMSRFMLAIKLITGNLGRIETMIFDEIDTGISGAIGLCVAKKLAELSRGHQVMCVTHLAQIAAMADGHYYIEKREVDGDTATRVTRLDRNGIVGELARLSGSKGISDSADKNAAELKSWCDNFKSNL